MCGICGFTVKSTVNADAVLGTMMSTIKHRGPDGEGKYIDDTIALGHVRLAVIDLSTTGKQPFFYGDNNRYIITFDGLIYNYKSLRVQLQQKGYSFTTQTDTEVLLAAYVQYGIEVGKYLDGMWAFAIYDRQKQTLFCSRDRFGIKPFYYRTIKNGGLTFASEIKQLLPLFPHPPKANIGALASFLLYGELDVGPYTLFDDVQQLPGGHYLLYDINENQYNISCWYHLPKEKTHLSFEDASSVFFHELDRCVQLYQCGDVPIGYCLSGGLDSSAIVCLASSNNIQNPQCVHSASPIAAFDEKYYAQLAAEKANATLHTVFAHPHQLLKELDRIIWHMDEPFGSTSVFAQWCVFKKAAELGLTVMLDGQGADEQLAGYTYSVPVLLAEFIRQNSKIGHHEFKEWRNLHPKIRHHSNKVYLLAYLYAYFPQAVAKNMMYSATALSSLFTKSAYQLAKTMAHPCRIRPADAFIEDSLLISLPVLLHYEDRNSMAFSIESRVPFLDHHLVEKIYSMPAHYKLRNGQTKAVMRQALKHILPKEIQTRQDKMGFVTPQTDWMNQNSNEFRVLLEEACDTFRGWINKKEIMRCFNSRALDDYTFWRIICASRWTKIFNISVDF